MRDGETKVGQRVLIPGRGLLAPDCHHSSDETPPPTKKQRGDNPTEVLESLLSLAKHSGATFAILGVHEDVGPRANFGRGGAGGAFDAAMRQFLNFQNNRFFDGGECLILGEVMGPSPSEVPVDECGPPLGTVEQLRAHVAELDKVAMMV